MNAQQIDDKARDLYHIYCQSVGGKAFNGADLPHWDEFGSDPAKIRQAEGWRRVAEAALGLVQPSQIPRGPVPDGELEKRALRAGEDQDRKTPIPQPEEGKTLSGITAPGFATEAARWNEGETAPAPEPEAEKPETVKKESGRKAKKKVAK